MKKLLLWGTTLLVLLTVNYQIVKKEAVLETGTTLLLALAPVDPRSLIQGDYMVLRYAIADEIADKNLPGTGRIVVSLDDNRVAAFLRLHTGEALKEGETLLFYRNHGGLRFGAESFMFQEGDADVYSKARYGELKVDESGSSILIGLRDSAYRVLGKTRK